MNKSKTKRTTQTGIKRAFLIFFFFLTCIKVADAQSGPVTTELRNQEHNARYKKVAPTLTRDNYCAEHYEDIKKVLLQSLYVIDGNLPAINESKLKRFEFLEREVHRHANKDEDYRKSLFRIEMYPDPDYWQWKLQRKIKPLIKSLESINWSDDRGKLLNYLNLLRSRIYYSTWEQGHLSRMSNDYIDLYAETIELYESIRETNEHFSRLGQSNRFDKAFGIDPVARTGVITFQAGVIPIRVKLIINCHNRFLANF